MSQAERIAVTGRSFPAAWTYRSQRARPAWCSSHRTPCTAACPSLPQTPPPPPPPSPPPPPPSGPVAAMHWVGWGRARTVVDSKEGLGELRGPEARVEGLRKGATVRGGGSALGAQPQEDATLRRAAGRQADEEAGGAGWRAVEGTPWGQSVRWSVCRAAPPRRWRRPRRLSRRWPAGRRWSAPARSASRGRRLAVRTQTAALEACRFSTTQRHWPSACCVGRARRSSGRCSEARW